MKELVFLQYGEHPIRIVYHQDNTPWFVAVDVCRVLGLGNPTRALESLDEDEKMQVVDPATLSSNQGTGINKLLNAINEPGLYHLMLISRKPEAKAFKRWVIHDVLPAIRKTGRYVAPLDSASTVIPLPKGVTWTKLAAAHRAFFRMAADSGFIGQEKLDAVHRAVIRAYGVDVTDLFAMEVKRAPHKEAPENRAERLISIKRGGSPLSERWTFSEPVFTDDALSPATMKTEVPMSADLRVTDLGGLLGGFSARKMNALLEEEGYQISIRVHGELEWCITEKGAPFAIKKYVPKSNGIGGSVPQILWNASILKALNQRLKNK